METLPGLVAESARRFDRRPALVIRPSFRTRTWRYRDLGELVPRAARVLADAGVGPGDRVILWAVNRPEWAIAFFAVAHGGAVSVPLDVRHTPEFAAKVATQTGARVVVASRQTETRAAALGLPVVRLETLPDLARRSEPLAAVPVTPDSLAEIVFTSGTTGDPKGAMLSHRNILACSEAMTSIVPFGANDRLLSVLPLSHLYEQVLGLVGPLGVGASIVYPVSRQPAVLLRTFRDFRISMILLVPQGLRLLSNTIERRVDQAGRRVAFERLHRLARPLPRPIRRLLFRPVLAPIGGRLHTVGIGASSIEIDVAQRWTEMGIDVLQGYGATEMGPVVSFTRPRRNRMETVGEAIPNVEIRIASDGEILARGPNRFLGYWQNPDATAAAIDADGWYHTGDLGQLAADGFLTFRGRKKDMLALPDGQKVYPEDVEAVLRQDARVTDATVVGWPQGPDLRVHAVLLLPDAATADAVVRAANERLAPHQRIRDVTVWPDADLPRTPTMKIRKPEVLARLALMGDPAAQPAGAGGPLVGPPEHADDPLAALVASVAGVPVARVTRDARLTSDLDLDSLGRVELLGVVEEELGVYVDESALDADASVSELAALIEESRATKRRLDAHRWPMNPLVRIAGLAFQVLLMAPFVHVFYRVRTVGRENLTGVEGPVLVTPNHCLHLDNAIILSHLPLTFRWKLAVAAGAETIYGSRARGILASVMANAFPIAREGAVRHSLELLGGRLDRGFSILLYPEGKLTLGGPLQPFKAGAGLIAVEGGTPVIPVRLRINRMSIIDRRSRPAPLRGDVDLVFGEPIWFDAETDPATATSRLEAAVAALEDAEPGRLAELLPA
jgi:long-chain acyl-CoA synthetase